MRVREILFVVADKGGNLLTEVPGYDNALMSGSVKAKPSAFLTRAAAQNSITRTKEYAKRQGYDWGEFTIIKFRAALAAEGGK